MKRKLKILNMADISVCPDVFESLDDIAETVSMLPDKKMLKENIQDCDVYFASLKIVVDREILDKAANLKVIATPSTGTDHIDVKYAKQKGIEIISLKDDIKFLENITSTAELAWALLLSSIRRIPYAFDDVRKGNWERENFRGIQLSGKTLGIIGYGRLGRIIADYGKAFRMKILACDVIKVFPSKDVCLVDMGTLLKEADVISIHVHLDESTKGLIDFTCFRQMKKGVVLINTSRGAVIDEKAFLKALESGHIGVAGIDVLDGELERNIKKHPLVKYAVFHDNLIISPHIGGVTSDSQQMVFEYTVKKLRNMLINEKRKAELK